MLLESPPPRISLDIRSILQVLKQKKVGDWYLYPNQTNFRIYGYEFGPYKLPTYLPMRLFALKYYRKIINSDEVHYFKAQKKAQLKIKDQLGTFVCNSREAGREADEILQILKQKQSFMWRYDPCDFIYKRRQNNKMAPYIHY